MAILQVFVLTIINLRYSRYNNLVPNVAVWLQTVRFFITKVYVAQIYTFIDLTTITFLGKTDIPN